MIENYNQRNCQGRAERSSRPARRESRHSDVTTRSSDRVHQDCAGAVVGIKEVCDDIRLVGFMDYDLGYFDQETLVLEPLENPFRPKVLPVS